MLSSQETLAEKFVNKGFWLYAITLIIGPLGYLIKVTISRDLSVEEVGMFYGVISFVTFLSIYNDLGFTESLLYFLPKQLIQKNYGKAKYLISLVFRTQIITSILIFIGLYFLAPWLADNYFKAPVGDILKIAGLFFIGINILHIAVIFFSAVQDTKLQKFSELFRITGTAIGTLFLFFTDSGNLERYMIIWILGLCVGIVFGMSLFIKKYYIPFFFAIKTEKDLLLRNQFFRYSGATLFTANIGVILSQVDMQLIIYSLGPTDVGFYSTYLSLISIPFIFISPILGFLFPVISELSERKDFDKMQFLIERFWKYFGIIGIWLGFFLFQFGEILSVLFFGEKFRESGEILMFSAPFIMLNILSMVLFQVLAGTGNIKKRIQILFITLLVNIPLNLILIPIYGTHGSALAVGLSWIVLYALTVRSLPSLKLNVFGNIFWYKNFFAGCIAFIGVYFIRENWKDLPLFSDVILAILLYLSIFIYSNKSILSEVFEIIQKVMKGKANTNTPSISSYP